MSHPFRGSRLHTLVVDGVFGGNIVDRGVRIVHPLSVKTAVPISSMGSFVILHSII